MEMIHIVCRLCLGMVTGTPGAPRTYGIFKMNQGNVLNFLENRANSKIGMVVFFEVSVFIHIYINNYPLYWIKLFQYKTIKRYHYYIFS